MFKKFQIYQYTFNKYKDTKNTFILFSCSLILFIFVFSFMSLVSSLNISLYTCIKRGIEVFCTYLSIYSLYFLWNTNYKNVRYFWFDFIPCINIIVFLYRFIIYVLQIIEYSILKLIESYKIVDSYRYCEQLKNSIKSTKKLTKTIENIKKESSVEADKLTKELLLASKTMIEVIVK